MNRGKAFVELNRELHEREQFDCQQPELNDFIRTRALRHMQAGVSRTLVLPSAKPLESGKFSICAFYTVAPGSISRESLPASLAKKLPRYPVPVFLLAQLAVDHNHQGSGLGKITLVRALHYLLAVHRQMPAYAVVVDCLNDDVLAFYTRFGFQELGVNNGRVRMFLPMKTVERLFVDA